jgi:hypothetical protein
MNGVICHDQKRGRGCALWVLTLNEEGMEADLGGQEAFLSIQEAEDSIEESFC